MTNKNRINQISQSKQAAKRLIWQQFIYAPKLQTATSFLKMYLKTKITQEYDNILTKLTAEIEATLKKGYNIDELTAKWEIDGALENYGIYLHSRELYLCTPHATVYIYKLCEYDAYYTSHLYTRTLNMLGAELQNEYEKAKTKAEAEYDRKQKEAEFERLINERNKLRERVQELETQLETELNESV